MDFNIFKKFFSIFSTQKDEELLLDENNEQTSSQIEIVKKENHDLEIINESHDYLKKLNEFVELTENLECNKLFVDVLNIAKKIHDKCVEKDEISIKRLSEYHSHFTDTFITTFNVVLEPLYPKSEIDETLKSDYALRKESDLDDKDGDYVYEKQKILKENIKKYDPYELIDELQKNEDFVSDKMSNGYALYMCDIFKLDKIIIETVKDKDNTLDINNSSFEKKYDVNFLGLSNIDNNPFFEESFKLKSKSEGYIVYRFDNIFKVDLKESVKINVLDVTEYKKKSFKSKLEEIVSKNKNKYKNG